MFPQEMIPQMFSNINTIYQLHHDFLLPQLEARMSNWHRESKIGKLLLLHCHLGVTKLEIIPFFLTLSWPAGHIFPTYKESFQVRWDKSIPLFLHAAIYLEVSLFRWTSQNAFSRETAVYKWYCVKCCIAAFHTFWLVQRNRDTSR